MFGTVSDALLTLTATALAGVLVFPGSVAAVETADEPAPSPPEVRPQRWVFAVEDTLDLPPMFEMSPVEIRAERLKIGDIVDRCIRSEEAIHDSIRTLEQTLIVKQVHHIGGYGEAARERLVIEQADRLLYRNPDVDRSIPLKLERYKIVDGERREWDEDDDTNVRVEFSTLNGMPFYLQNRDGYSFEILSRDIVGDRVLYEVRIEPKSDFEIAPEGTLWIDASNFRILREEFDMGDRVPMPLFVKSIGPIIRERQRIGDVWVWKRLLFRVDIRTGLLRYLDGDIPDTIEFVATFRDFVVNEGLSDEPEGTVPEPVQAGPGQGGEE